MRSAKQFLTYVASGPFQYAVAEALALPDSYFDSLRADLHRKRDLLGVGSDPAPRPKRRTFTSEYELRIVAEYDAAPRNEKGAVLRRERLYHSHVKEWRVARDRSRAVVGQE